jgi:HPt (histidine-containing phosphotransfer) domain-containing protein
MKYLKPVSWQPVADANQPQAKYDLQQKLKSYFVKDNKNSISEIKKALSEGEVKRAHRLAHSLKSNAGQLGETLLQEAAADVENNLKDGKNLVSLEQLALLEKELNEVLAEFGPQLVPLPESSQPVEQIEPLEVFAKLEPLLEMGSPECRDLTGSLRLIPGSEELIQQLEDFDFEQAIVTLAGLKNKIMKVGG